MSRIKRIIAGGVITIMAVGGMAAPAFANCYGNPFCQVNCALNPSACPPPCTNISCRNDHL